MSLGDTVALRLTGDGAIGNYDVVIEQGQSRASVLSGKGAGPSVADTVSLSSHADGLYSLRVRAAATAYDTDAFIKVGK